MKDKFISNEGFEIPLHQTNFTFTEENPRFKDSFWTNYTLPIDYYYHRNFLSQFGNYASLHASGLKRYHQGVHFFEGKPRVAKLEVMEFTNERIKIQIDSGFEDLPNFDKKLEDLPLLDIEVDDIYNHANDIVQQKYPETVYNFPKLYTDEYDLDSEPWKYFDSFLNNRADYESTSGKVFLRNRLEDQTDVYNKNIIHPMPYLLYVLKVGFQDAGFQLEGEILEDAYLKQRLIYSGRAYYNTGDQKEHKVYIYHQDFDNTGFASGQGKWSKTVRVNAPGRYKMTVKVPTYGPLTGVLRVASSQISGLRTERVLQFNVNSQTQIIDFDISEEEAELGGEILFNYQGVQPANQTDSEGKSLGAVQIYINPQRTHSTSGEVIPFVFNENRVRLKKAMPEMTFGELVTIVKNLRNYDVEFQGNRAIMNTIKLSPEAVLDFSRFEAENPTRMFNDKVSFNIKFPENDEVELQNIYFDESGYHLNQKNIPEMATEISINALCLPLTMFRGSYTAKALAESSTLMLVYYDGLNRDGDNHATNPTGLNDETLAKHLEPWYLNRLTNYTYKWTFITEKNKIRNFNIRSEIHCYGRRHLIKSWTKTSLTPQLYSVEIETETY